MKFVCDRNTLYTKIKEAERFVSQQSLVTLNSCLLLSILGNDLTIMGQDVSIGYETCLFVDGIEDGACLVNCNKLAAVLKNLQNGMLEVASDDKVLSIKEGKKKAKYSLYTFDTEETINKLKKSVEGTHITVNVRALIEGIDLTGFCASNDETKEAMQGLQFELEGNMLTIVTTDGRCLARYVTRYVNSPEKETPKSVFFTLPRRFTEIIKKGIEIEDAVLDLEIAPNALYITLGDTTIYSCLINTPFPNWKRVIPETNKNMCIFDRKTFLSAVERIAPFIDNKFNKIEIKMNVGTLSISSGKTTIGQGEEEMPAEYYGEEIKTAMNWKYIAEPLKKIKVDKVVLKFNEPNKAFTLTDVQDERDVKCLYIIMPMNINK